MYHSVLNSYLGLADSVYIRFQTVYFHDQGIRPTRNRRIVKYTESANPTHIENENSEAIPLDIISKKWGVVQSHLSDSATIRSSRTNSTCKCCQMADLLFGLRAHQSPFSIFTMFRSPGTGASSYDSFKKNSSSRLRM